MVMLDPKYEGLPGIAVGEKDLYETSDLPEADQTPLSYEETSDSVEVITVSADDAHGKFKGKVCNPTRADFSDSVTPHTRRGYDTRHGDYELAADRENETVVQKYHRLKCELEELTEQVHKIKDDVSGGGEGSLAVDTRHQVSALQQQLVNIKLEEVLGSQLLQDVNDPHHANQKKLLTYLSAMKSSESGSKVASGDSKDRTCYELYYSPENNKFTELSVLTSLQQRMDKLDHVIGATDDKLSHLTAETGQKSLLGAVSLLNSKLTLLDPVRVDSIEGRLSALNTKLTTLKQHNKQHEDSDKQNKISELYDVVKESEVLYASVPNIVDRLVVLEGLHEQALEFSKALSQLDSMQNQLTGKLQDNKKLLSDVSENLTANVNTIQNNINNLDQRITALNK